MLHNFYSTPKGTIAPDVLHAGCVIPPQKCILNSRTVIVTTQRKKTKQGQEVFTSHQFILYFV